ncbi:UNVERIFIED_CONTAM: Protein yippee-like protein [Sesamum indicum]
MAAINSKVKWAGLRAVIDSLEDFWAIFEFAVKVKDICEVSGLGSFCSMGEVVGPRLYCCYKCRNHVSLHDDIISKAFQGRHGRAFLFSHAMNIVVGVKEDRHLMTGLHTVADISCADCNEVLGWKYERAYEASQKYKEGKFIFEKSKIVKENW